MTLTSVLCGGPPLEETMPMNGSAVTDPSVTGGVGMVSVLYPPATHGRIGQLIDDIDSEDVVLVGYNSKGDHVGGLDLMSTKTRLTLDESTGVNTIDDDSGPLFRAVQQALSNVSNGQTEKPSAMNYVSFHCTRRGQRHERTRNNGIGDVEAIIDIRREGEGNVG